MVHFASSLIGAGFPFGEGLPVCQLMIGLFKTEVIRRRGPWKGLEANSLPHSKSRLVQQSPPAQTHRQHPPPAEAEDRFFADNLGLAMVA
jgi:hypothetical protein